MADLKRFSNIETTGLPSAPIQQFAVDESGATRRQGTAGLVESLTRAGGQAFQAVDTAQTNRAIEDLVGGPDSQIPGMVKDGSELSAEEASFLNFQQIAQARGQGLSADRAAVAASTRLQQAIARDPRRADAFKKAYNNFFSGTATFQQTQSEELQERVIEYGLTKFGLDPRQALENPQQWERRFQDNMLLLQQQEEVERMVNLSDSQLQLSQNQQQDTLPTLVSSSITNPDSQLYIPGNIDSVLERYTSDSGEIDVSRSAGAVQELRVQKQATIASLRSTYSALSSTQFESIVGPINDYYENAEMVATGEMELAALERERNIQQESAILSMRSGNPEAARELIGINSLTEGQQNVSPSVTTRQAELINILSGSMNGLMNPNAGMAPSDVLDENKMGDYNRWMQDTLDSVTSIGNDTDTRTGNRATDALVLTANSINRDAGNMRAPTYTKYFTALLNPEIDDRISEEQRATIEESLGSTSMQEFLSATLEQWRTKAPQNTRVVYNDDTNRIELFVEQGATGKQRADARKVVAEMKNSNLYFTAADKFLGVGGKDILADSEMGRNLLELSGIEVGPEEAESAGFEQVGRMRERRREVSNIAGQIISGDATEEDIQLFNTLLDEEEGLRNNPFPKLQDALDMLEGENSRPFSQEDRDASRANTQANAGRSVANMPGAFSFVAEFNESRDRPADTQLSREDVEEAGITDLADFIGSAESGNTYNIVVGGDTDDDLTSSTISDLSESYGDRKALGRYQIQIRTAKDVLRANDIDPDEFTFDQDGQDRIYKMLLERRGLEDYQEGNITKEEFATNLSKEWAALPKDDSNESYYSGVGDNKALVTWDALLEMIEGINFD